MHIHLHNNPFITDIGTTPSEIVTVDSGFTGGYSQYEFRYKNQPNIKFKLDSRQSYPNSNVVSISVESVQIFLPMRTKFQVRRKHNSGDWDNWTTFKTSDKKYSTPGATLLLSDNSDDSAAQHGNVTIVVENHSHCEETRTARGSTVVVNSSHNIDISLERLSDGRVVRKTTIQRKDQPPSIGHGYVTPKSGGSGSLPGGGLPG